MLKNSERLTQLVVVEWDGELLSQRWKQHQIWYMALLVQGGRKRRFDFV